MKKITTIILDLDDTLIDTSHLYWVVKVEILNLISQWTKVSIKDLDIEFEEIESQNSKIHGHDPYRYKYSAIELCKRKNIEEYSKIQHIGDVASKIAQSDPSLIDGAIEILEYLQSKYNLTLITRGESKLQTRKIKNNGLDKYFNETNTKIVSSKDSKTFKDFIDDRSLKKENCIVIGDSIKSDINPAIECGIDVIHYKYKHEHYEWEQDKAESKYDFKSVDFLEDIKKILQV